MIHYHDSTNTFFQLAESFVNFTDQHLFLTGKAGTGKTTFLRHIIETTHKTAVVVAPTGVAAINARGVTMHSFFQLPFVPFVPANMEDPSGRFVSPISLFRKIKFSDNKRKLLQELELLIIDEISMVRADMLDAVDVILRHFRRRQREPFGGVQVLMIGDLFQLPPVVGHDDQRVLSELYKSPFFFDSRVLRESPPVCIELQKIYRQKDLQFIDLLNRVRNNEVTEEDLDWLNNRFTPDFKPPQNEKYITLTSHNYIADEINENELNKLPGKTHEFEAEIEGEFNEKAYPAGITLQLKEGAQIMFIKNDKGEIRRYYNGKIGTVKEISEDKIFVTFPDEQQELELEIEEWENIRYKFNEEKKKTEEEKIGSFRQYPIRLAWAITIHKSQGLTFERAVIDAGSSFTAGQVYVALSRLTNLEGLVLRSRIRRSGISCDSDVLNFMARQQDELALTRMLSEGQKGYICKTLINSFDFSQLLYALRHHIATYKEKKSPFSEVAIKEGSEWHLKIEALAKVSDQFRQTELSGLLAEGEAGYPRLHERMKNAVDYFQNRLKEDLFDSLERHIISVKSKGKAKKYTKALYLIQLLVLERKKAFDQCLMLTQGLFEGKNSIDLLRKLSERDDNVDYDIPEVSEQKQAKKGESQLMSLELFKTGKTVEEIATERGLATSTIEGHLSQFVKTGELSVFDLLPEEKINAILPMVIQSEDLKATPIRERLGDDYGYGEIRLVINHWLWEQEKKVGERA